MYSSLRSQVFTRCRTKVQLQRPKKSDVSVTKDLWSFYPGIKACECLPRAYFILTDMWKIYSRPMFIVTTDWRVNKLMNTTSNLWFTIYYMHTVSSKIVYWDHHHWELYYGSGQPSLNVINSVRQHVFVLSYHNTKEVERFLLLKVALLWKSSLIFQHCIWLDNWEGFENQKSLSERKRNFYF